jgi:MFS family permease
MSSAAAALTVPLKQDLRTISLVSLAHGTSHFFHLLLPPMFPVFRNEFGATWSELGLLMTIFFVISCIGQATAGFVVDRIGARPVMFAALGCFVLAALAAATAQGYSGLVLAAVLAGVANSPFHPVDFTILNKRVSQPRLGHAFSAHGLSGSLGWAAAPVFLVGLHAATGSWRIAYVATAGVALAVLLLLLSQREAIDDRAGATRGKAAGASVAVNEHAFAFLKLGSVWLCFIFFFFSTAALAAIQSFASPALGKMYGLAEATTAFVVTGYMLFSALGMIAGGFLPGRVQRLELTIGAALAGAALLLLLVASGWLPGPMALFVATVAGFSTGLAGPSRDMLIKKATPPGATGRVYGTVYSGLDLGFAVAAPAFGWLLDRAAPSSVFYGAAATLVFGIVAAGAVGWTVVRPRIAAAQA